MKRTMASARSPISSRRPRSRASSSSRRTASPAATSSAPPLKGIRDVIAPGLRVLFVGINPGLMSAATGHHFARPGNRFWPALHQAGFTPRLLRPAEQRRLLDYGYGVTNIVNRPSASADELAPAEFVAGRRRLVAKIRRTRPQIVAFLGVGAYCHAFGLQKARIGLQAERIEGAEVWLLPNPSGLNANYQLPALVQLFGQLWQRSSKSRYG